MEEHMEGFSAIAKKVQELYPNQEAPYYGPVLPYMLGGDDPLDGIEVWKNEKGIPHWHYVTYGFTELYEKESEDPSESGYGFELTFRLKRDPEEEQPPAWPMNLLQNLARYVFSSGNVFRSGHHMSCNGPVMLGSDTKLTALGFLTDPELGEMDTVNGHMVFLQAIPITDDEMKGLMCWSGEKFLRALMEKIPLGIGDLSRDSIMERPDFHSIWEQGIAADGSNTGFLYMDEMEAGLDGEQGRLRVGAGHVDILGIMLRARVGKGRTLYLQGARQSVLFQGGAQNEIALDEHGTLVIGLTENGLRELCKALVPHAGSRRLQEIPLTMEIVPTCIKDQHGNVLETIE